MTYYDTLLQQDAFRKMIDISEWPAPHGVTLNLKKCIKVTDDRNIAYTIFISDELATQNFRHFLNKINKTLFGNNGKRKNMKTKVFPVRELGSLDGRLHYHAVIDCPNQYIQPVFPDLINHEWTRTQWGYGHNDIIANVDAGWISYITKLHGKPLFSDYIDWENLNI